MPRWHFPGCAAAACGPVALVSADADGAAEAEAEAAAEPVAAAAPSKVDFALSRQAVSATTALVTHAATTTLHTWRSIFPMEAKVQVGKPCD